MRYLGSTIPLLAFGLTIAGPTPIQSPAAPPLAPVHELAQHARERVKASARAPLGDVAISAPAPNYLRATAGTMPQIVHPLRMLVEAVLYRGALSTETKAAMGLRVAQVNASPYVAAHMMRLLRASDSGRRLLTAIERADLRGVDRADALAVDYAEALSREVHAVTDDQFARTRVVYNDAEIVELTLTSAFFNFFTRYVEALHLPVEAWALDDSVPVPSSYRPPRSVARVALLSNDEVDAAAAALSTARAAGPPAGGGLGLGMANSQRAMLQSPDLALAWRAFGAGVREHEVVSRAIKLQVSLAVSTANSCRYCTLHQVLGLRRLGVEPAKLMALQKDDRALAPSEAIAVRFARRLTAAPGGITDADYAPLRTEFGERGAIEVVLQTCTFAFMNRVTDGLRLPSEDEAVRVYQETYGTGALQ
jgi:AhpD family alkylhydroperoxidase